MCKVIVRSHYIAIRQVHDVDARRAATNSRCTTKTKTPDASHTFVDLSLEVAVSLDGLNDCRDIEKKRKITPLGHFI